MSLSAVCLSLAQPSAHRLDDQGVFLLLLNGQQIGTEKFKIKSSNRRIEAKADIEIRTNQDGRAVEVNAFPDLVLDEHLQPITYSWSQKGSQSSRLEADFGSSPVRCRYKTLTGQEDNRDFTLSKDVVVVDATGVIHHYQLLAERFKAAGRSKQTFHAFVPQEAWPTDLTVEDRGIEPVDLRGRTQTLNHLVVTTERAAIDLWVDGSGRLERLLNSQEHFEALRRR